MACYTQSTAGKDLKKKIRVYKWIFPLLLSTLAVD